VSAATARHLAEKFGTTASSVLMPTVQTPALLSGIVPHSPSILAEVLYCIRYEMAVSIEDILARRIGLQLFSWRDAIVAAPIVAQFLEDELGWSQMQTRGAVEQYTNKINRLLATVGLARQAAELSIPRH
jgi:glycerol-3-phosphate dehydrogenase